ncbi:DUF1566 domain-containing protein [bacterium]|nr:DUF1566 domain-containing protein [bacterium]
MKKLQMITVLILTLLFVSGCIPDDDDEEDFWNNDQTDTVPGGNSDTMGDTLPDSPTDTDSTDTLPDTSDTSDTTDTHNDPSDSDVSDTAPNDNDTTDTVPDNDSDAQPAPDNDTTPAPDNDTVPVSDDDTEPANDNDLNDNDTIPAPDNDTETPDGDTDTAPEEPTPEQKCIAESGTWNDDKCTKEANCNGSLPANAEWNSGSKFTQTLDGTTWIPATKAAAYGEEGECSFKCTGTYLWNTTECVNDPCYSDPCSTINNANPDSCIATDTAFTCTCSGEYHWEIDKCEDNTRMAYCTLPAHAHWNTETTPTVEQTWICENEECGWSPSTEGTYDPDETEGCHFSCNDDSHWEEASGKCELNIPVCAKGSETPCIDPEYGYIWSDVHPNTQTWSKAVEWCSNLEEGGYPKGTWKLPTIDQLRTLVKECSKTKYEEEYGEGTCKVSDPSCLSAYNTACYSSADCSCNADNNGGHSKFGETLLLWSNSSASTDTAWRLLFSNASIASDYKYVSDARSRCVYVPEND